MEIPLALPLLVFVLGDVFYVFSDCQNLTGDFKFAFFTTGRIFETHVFHLHTFSHKMRLKRLTWNENLSTALLRLPWSPGRVCVVTKQVSETWRISPMVRKWLLVFFSVLSAFTNGIWIVHSVLNNITLRINQYHELFHCL